jgi:hypothetical protein
MARFSKIGILLLAAVVALAGAEVGEGVSVLGIKSFVSRAKAGVGRPLTPISVAGVARPTDTALHGRCVLLLSLGP